MFFALCFNILMIKTMILFYWFLLGICIVIMIIVGMIQFSNLFALLRTKGVPYVPLFGYQLRYLKKFIKFDNPNIKLVDLGSGDGRVLRVFEKMGIKDITGYEINWWAHFKGCCLKRIKKSHVKLCLKNFHRINLSEYDVVFCYLLDTALKRLREKFDQELKPGSRIISYAFQIPDWHEPDQIIVPNEKHPGRDRIYIYDIK
ncbi:hypothetical protein COT97_04760 [Candidatus Falkowbacteria bacterium CG10_big_fil_rev_8_21_14_0_10_39_11]|uniref:SAM-dependent methyltransferase n=1 Tax=Candidatus Falkowbacteria bacterium CG10_big_fil_rev_8_21_14_0_10_39_11 TaxID=1974565 RepID=A0A2H0V451_9BACT|nr:MAG: hypothetical protein COT97_04760 [Candidatus Falkowbacteria bacterium CG10_big_fil_rev_8_21_14_0_10_39_11]